jgi:phage terminase small subunit
MPRGRPKVPPTPVRPQLVSVPPPDLPEPPAHLSPDMQVWWREVTNSFDLDSHDLLRLEATCGAWDRMVGARCVIEKNGMTFTDGRGMIRARPEVSIERDARVAFMRGVRELDLGIEPPPLNRPPALRSNRRG